MLLDVSRDTRVSTEALIDEYVERFRSLDIGNQIPRLIEEQKQKKELALKKKSKLLEYNVTGVISDSDFISMNKQCAEEIADAENQITELEQQLYPEQEFRKQIDALKSTMRALEQTAATGAITPEFINEYIDKIFVTPEREGVMRLDIKIFTGESTHRYFEKLIGRSGHMNKKEIEAGTSVIVDSADKNTYNTYVSVAYMQIEGKVRPVYVFSTDTNYANSIFVDMHTGEVLCPA